MGETRSDKSAIAFVIRGVACLDIESEMALISPTI